VPSGVPGRGGASQILPGERGGGLVPVRNRLRPRCPIQTGLLRQRKVSRENRPCKILAENYLMLLQEFGSDLTPRLQSHRLIPPGVHQLLSERRRRSVLPANESAVVTSKLDSDTLNYLIDTIEGKTFFSKFKANPNLSYFDNFLSRNKIVLLIKFEFP
jgi:hypothetical protein